MSVFLKAFCWKYCLLLWKGAVNIKGDIPTPGEGSQVPELYYIKILEIQYLDKKITMKCFVARQQTALPL